MGRFEERCQNEMPGNTGGKCISSHSTSKTQQDPEVNLTFYGDRLTSEGMDILFLSSAFRSSRLLTDWVWHVHSLSTARIHCMKCLKLHRQWRYVIISPLGEIQSLILPENLDFLTPGRDSSLHFVWQEEVKDKGVKG